MIRLIPSQSLAELPEAVRSLGPRSTIYEMPRVSRQIRPTSSDAGAGRARSKRSPGTEAAAPRRRAARARPRGRPCGRPGKPKRRSSISTTAAVRRRLDPRRRLPHREPLEDARLVGEPGRLDRGPLAASKRSQRSGGGEQGSASRPAPRRRCARRCAGRAAGRGSGTRPLARSLTPSAASCAPRDLLGPVVHHEAEAEVGRGHASAAQAARRAAAVRHAPPQAEDEAEREDEAVGGVDDRHRVEGEPLPREGRQQLRAVGGEDVEQRVGEERDDREARPSPAASRPSTSRAASRPPGPPPARTTARGSARGATATRPSGSRGFATTSRSGAMPTIAPHTSAFRPEGPSVERLAERRAEQPLGERVHQASLRAARHSRRKGSARRWKSTSATAAPVPM